MSIPPPPGADQLVREAAEFFERGVQLDQRRWYQPALEAFEAALTGGPRSARKNALRSSETTDLTAP